jgi:hypothetical protein
MKIGLLTVIDAMTKFSPAIKQRPNQLVSGLVEMQERICGQLARPTQRRWCGTGVHL